MSAEIKECSTGYTNVCGCAECTGRKRMRSSADPERRKCKCCDKPLRFEGSKWERHDRYRAPESCWDCGRKFDRRKVYEEPGKIECTECACERDLVKRYVYDHFTPIFELPGYMGTGLFCTKTCGYRFGVAVARRLMVEQSQDKKEG